MPKYHRVVQGDYLTKIAQQYNFTDYQTIWNHPGNAQLKVKRKTPYILLPGDILVIPDLQDKQETRATGRQHVFKIAPPTVVLHIVIKDSDHKAMSSLSYLLSYGNTMKRGTTGADGKIETEIPIDTEEVNITLTDLEFSWTARVGHLDPIDDPNVLTGVQARLNNLGFYSGDVDGNCDEHFTAALTAFQRIVLNQENSTGQLDAHTRQALKSSHGC